jgi:hypothetical protein
VQLINACLLQVKAVQLMTAWLLQHKGVYDAQSSH